MASEPAGRGHVLPRQRPPLGQGHVRVPRHRARATRPWPPTARHRPRGPPRRHHHLGVVGRATRWRSYLVQVAIGDFEVGRRRHQRRRVPIRHVAATVTTSTRGPIARWPAPAEMLDVMAGCGARTRSRPTASLSVDEDLGFALETQTPDAWSARDTARTVARADEILVHELAHQWVGDAVSPATWKDIWLNEGFATYSEWLWSERTGAPPAALLAREPGRGGLRPPARRSGLRTELFQGSVYLRGAARCRRCGRRSETTRSSRCCGRGSPSTRVARPPPPTWWPWPSGCRASSSTSCSSAGSTAAPPRSSLPRGRQSQAGRLRLEGVDRAGAAQGDPDVVEALEEALADGVLERELRLEADGRGRDGAPLDVDRELEAGSASIGGEQLLADLARHSHRHEAVLRCSCCGRCRRTAG